MNRRKFLAFLGIGTASAFLAPKVLPSEPKIFGDSKPISWGEVFNKLPPEPSVESRMKQKIDDLTHLFKCEQRKECSRCTAIMVPILRERQRILSMKGEAI